MYFETKSVKAIHGHRGLLIFVLIKCTHATAN